MASRVVKLGGSLLDLEDLIPRLVGWLRQQPEAANLLVMGGGRRAQELRGWDQLQPLDPVFCHWLGVEMMAANARWLAAHLSRSVWVTSREEFERLARRGVAAILDPVRFLRKYPQHAGIKLPTSWDVTSDSISAYAAAVVEATELVLLKSRSPEDHWNLEQAARRGYVDPHFPQVAALVPQVRCVDFRSGSLEETVWTTT